MSDSALSDLLTEKATALLDRCRKNDLLVATAESCTGGLIMAALTAIPGSSDVVERGFVTYSNQAKIDMLGVPAAAILQSGAVSAEVAIAMVEGALHHSKANLAVSVTGIAGPSGGSDEKPVGTVYIAAMRQGGALACQRNLFSGSRDEIREESALAAMDMLLKLAAKN